MQKNKDTNIIKKLKPKILFKVLSGVLLINNLCFAANNKNNWSELHEFLFNPSDLSIRTDSVIIVKDGKVLYEEYRDPNFKVHKIWSISKSLTNALVGIAIKNKKLKLTDSICNYYPNLEKEKCNIKVRHLLEWSSGIDWIEDYSEKPDSSSVLQMFYGDGVNDMVQFALEQPLKFVANTHWNYSSADPMILMGILKHIYGSKTPNFPQKLLFEPLKMKETIWEADSAGTFLASSHAFSTPRDLARFGQWIMHDGKILLKPGDHFSQKRLLPLYWRHYSTQVSSAYKATTDLLPGQWGADTPGGAGWWPNKGVPELNKSLPWPSAPKDAFAGLGFKGQYLFVIPSQKLVIVRLGYDANNTAFDANKMLSLIENLHLNSKNNGDLL